MDPNEALNLLLNEGIKPHVEAISKIILRRRVAVVVHKPSPAAKDILTTSLNWNGEPVFTLSANQRASLAAAWLETGDKVAVRWLCGKVSKSRILVFSGNGTLLFNFTPGKGFTLEPGTLG